MTDTDPFREHQKRAVKARWAKTTPAERSAYARKMVAAREAKRAAAKQTLKDSAA